jgi:dolichol-phosphate mannosyltransferase
MKKLSVIVPVYFNAGSLPPLFDRLLKIEGELSLQGMELDLIFVDDGSGDASFHEMQIIKKARPLTKLIKLTRNFGSVHACKCGLQFATGDCFMILAADLQDPPELIFQLVEKWKAGSKFTVCTRFSRDDPFLSKCMAAIYYWLLRLLVVPHYPTGGYDMALMDKALLPYIQQSSKNLYIPLLAWWLGYRPEIIPYHRVKREHGKSRWTFRKKLKAFTDIMLGFSVTPIRLMSGIGLIVSTLSISYGLYVIVHAIIGDIPVKGFASLVALITFLLGLIIVMLGIIGEYLWRIFDEVNKRPEVVIDEVY